MRPDGPGKLSLIHVVRPGYLVLHRRLRKPLASCSSRIRRLELLALHEHSVLWALTSLSGPGATFASTAAVAGHKHVISIGSQAWALSCCKMWG